jgi:hypothetical protein
MARRDTIRKSSLSTLPDPDAAIRFRDHLVEHITWIEASHRDDPHNMKIVALYRRQLVGTSVLIARLKAEHRKAEQQRARVSHETQKPTAKAA